MLVALSGGPDSVALLLLAHAVLGDRCRAATVDHGLRPAARDEAQAAAALCTAMELPHRILQGPLPARVGRTANLSARARALRYDLLREEAARTGADWIATGHHADDQFETLVLRLNRGAGVGGLAAVRPSGWRVIRPLLGWRRAELAALVAAAGLTPADDPTNRDDRFDRARLRKALGPTAWLNPAGLAASTAALGEAEEALTWTAQRLLSERCEEAGEAMLLDPAGLPAELLRRLLRGCVARLDPAAAPDGPAYDRALAALLAGRPASLGAVVIASGPRWRFRPAPPRRRG